MAGRPNEYFWRDELARLLKDWQVADEETYLSRVLTLGTTPNGVFGLKLMWTYLDSALDFLRRATGHAQLDDAALLDSVFPSPRFIWVWRHDVVAQAVSWAKAVQTGEWYAGDPRRSPLAPKFDFAQIHNLVWVSVQLHGMALRWFGRHSKRPLVVCYEDLVSDLQGTVATVLRFLEIPAPDRGLCPSLRPQADALNAEWSRLYREEARRLSPEYPLLIDPLPPESSIRA